MNLFNRLRKENGVMSLGYMLASLLILGIILLLFEFYRIYTIKQNLDVELSRAVNIALDLSMMDIYRRDHQLELDAGSAKDHLFSYLNNELKLDGNLRYHDSKGKEVFELNIDDLFIQKAPPVIKLRVSVIIKPTYFGNMYLDNIRFTVKAASQNNRIGD